MLQQSGTGVLESWNGLGTEIATFEFDALFQQTTTHKSSNSNSSMDMNIALWNLLSRYGTELTFTINQHNLSHATAVKYQINTGDASFNIHARCHQLAAKKQSIT